MWSEPRLGRDDLRDYSETTQYVRITSEIWEDHAEPLVSEQRISLIESPVGLIEILVPHHGQELHV